MLGLIMMSVPLGMAVGLSAVALVWAEPDGSAGGVLTSCVSGSGSQAPPLNYVSFQAYQAPAVRNDTFG
ncbi:hypothetical protein AB4097_19240 [Microvirga sp. 2MCAF35]|uniref:hypothetical protein n=1 Tax=Microvirga sp. 2MCAF35 TaxID=3232987 RepID=UPI003F9B6E61